MPNIKELDRRISYEVTNYIYNSTITTWLTLMGHWVCSKLSKHDKLGRLVLDIGCGTGPHFRFIKNASYVGIDQEDRMLSKAKYSLDGRGILVKADLYTLPFPDCSVDSIILSGVLEHLEDLPRALVEFRRVLQPNGELIILQVTEGFLYRIGRKLTTERYIKRTMEADYKGYIEREHVWGYKDVLSEVRRYFKSSRLVGIPVGIPVGFSNAYIVGRFVNDGN